MGLMKGWGLLEAMDLMREVGVYLRGHGSPNGGGG